METLNESETQSVKVIAPDAIKRAKQARFALSATMLAGKPIACDIVSDANGQPAWFDVKKHVLTFNEAWLKQADEIEVLTTMRALLYHEILGHARQTSTRNNRKELTMQAANPQAYLAISNILEDGRIERNIKTRWQGAGEYLDALLADVVKQGGPSEIDGLVLYVRTHKWRNAHEAAFWQPYEALIEQAVKAKTTRKACEIAAQICEGLYGRKGEKSEGESESQGESESEAEGKGEGESESQGESESEAEGEGKGESESQGESESEAEGEGKGESESQGESESEAEGEGEGESESQGESESEAEGEGESDDETSGNSADDSAAQDRPANVDESTWNEIQDIVNKAKVMARKDSEADWEAILEAADNEEPIQAYATKGSEETMANDIATILQSLLVELARTKYAHSREGLLNSLALTKALTNRRCFQTREETPATPKVAMLIDCSSSMRDNAAPLTSAARILNGALIQAKIAIKTIAYCSGCGVGSMTEYSVIPTRPLPCDGGTPTGKAMQLGNDWLEGEGSQRGLMLIITDGEPCDGVIVREQLQRAREGGTYVVGVLIGDAALSVDPAIEAARRRIMGANYVNLDECFDSRFSVADINDLPAQLETALLDFVAGT